MSTFKDLCKQYLESGKEDRVLMCEYAKARVKQSSNAITESGKVMQVSFLAGKLDEVYEASTNVRMFACAVFAWLAFLTWVENKEKRGGSYE